MDDQHRLVRLWSGAQQGIQFLPHFAGTRGQDPLARDQDYPQSRRFIHRVRRGRSVFGCGPGRTASLPACGSEPAQAFRITQDSESPRFTQQPLGPVPGHRVAHLLAGDHGMRPIQLVACRSVRPDQCLGAMRRCGHRGRLGYQNFFRYQNIDDHKASNPLDALLVYFLEIAFPDQGPPVAFLPNLSMVHVHRVRRSNGRLISLRGSRRKCACGPCCADASAQGDRPWWTSACGSHGGGRA